MDLNYMIWRDAFVVAVATTVLLVTYVVAGAPTREPSRLGTRGLKRGRAIAEGGLFAQLEPLVRWLGVRVSGLLSEEARMKLEKQLRIAGYFLGLTAEELAGLILLGTLGGALFGVVGGLALGNARLILLFAVPLGAGAPLLAVSGEDRKSTRLNSSHW